MHKNYNAPSKILDEYSEHAWNKARVIAVNEFYSTRLINFFQDKIFIEWVESSKMSTLLPTNDAKGIKSEIQAPSPSPKWLRQKIAHLLTNHSTAPKI